MFYLKFYIFSLNAMHWLGETKWRNRMRRDAMYSFSFPPTKYNASLKCAVPNLQEVLGFRKRREHSRMEIREICSLLWGMSFDAKTKWKTR